jgi:hypothetical protein
MLCLGLLTAYVACEKDDSVVKETDTTSQEVIPTIKTVSYDKVGATFNRLKSDYKIDGFLQSNEEANLLGKSTIDTLGITIFTDEIKEVTIGDYTSYTMRIASPNTDNTKFYNVTIEDKNGESGMFVTKYTPTQNWLENKNTAFDGGISTHRVNNDITEVIDDTGGFGGTNNYGVINSTVYPEDCDGWVETTINYVAVPCECDPHHAPDECDTSTCSTPGFWAPVATYECFPFDMGGGDDDPYDTYDPNTNPGGAVNFNPPDDDDDSYSAMVPPTECDVIPPASLNRDCTVDDYERLIFQLGITDSDTQDFVINNIDISDQIIDYLEENNYSDGAIEFAILAIEALNEDGVDDGEVDFEEQIIKDSSLPNCVKVIIDAMIADNTYLDLGDMDDSVLEQLNLAGHIMNTFNNSDNYNLTFKMASLPPNSSGNLRNAETTARASTTSPGHFDITITLDSNYITNGTDLAIARTIIHESLHAYLTYITQEDFIGTMAQRLSSLSISLGNDVNQAQHIEMSNNFVEAISLALKNWHNSALANNDYYDYLSWSGAMLTTQAFLDKPASFQTNSINANSAEGNVANASTSIAQGINDSNCP